MPLRTVSQIAVNSDLGITHVSQVFKPAVPAATIAGGWVDTSMSSGTPKYNAYVGGQLDSTAFVGSRNNSINVGSKSDYLLSAMFQTRSAVVPAYVMILDYLMFYPLADLDSTDIQETAVVDVLPRYQTGVGVQIMPVITLPSTGFTDCTIVYTNSAGVANRTTTFRLLQGTTVGSIAASAGLTGGLDTPFVPLANGDSGVRSIESVVFATGVGGFACFVLVKPLATVVVPEINTCSEVSFVGNKFSLPRVFAGANLNFVIKTQVVAASSWLAQLTFIGV